MESLFLLLALSIFLVIGVPAFLASIINSIKAFLEEKRKKEEAAEKACEILCTEYKSAKNETQRKKRVYDDSKEELDSALKYLGGLVGLSLSALTLILSSCSTITAACIATALGLGALEALGVFVAILAALALIGGLIYFTILYIRKDLARSEYIEARDKENKLQEDLINKCGDKGVECVG